MELRITNRFSSFGLIFSAIVHVTLVTVVTCYNLDTRSPVIKTGEKGTFFGFSVAIHSVGEDDMLIVGAPRDDSGLSNTTGAVYRCPVLPFDDESNCERFSEERDELTRNKSNQWLGATVRSAGTDDTVVACAPFSKEVRSDSGVHPSGKCIFYSSNFSHANTIAPCEPPADEPGKSPFRLKSHCLAGISAEKIGADFVIGGPGSFTAQGSVFTFSESAQEYITPNEENERSDGNYQGYSVTYGNFSSGDELNIVTGAPRGSMLLGVVRIYTQDMVLLRELEGHQTGSYFGESVAASDLNDDGFDDLVVGASNYWNRETHQTDVGQVIIFYQTSLGTFDESNTVITGQHEGGRFGLVVTALGDINNDGVNDLAIGAPYEGSGAVYIYNGRRGEKIKAKPSQILRPSDLNMPLERFGFALSANRDADKNMYPDLLVGSYLSDKVVLFRTKPVIRPLIKITFESEAVYLKTKNVTWGGRFVSGFGGTICMSYGGLGTKDSYEFDITITMDAEKQVNRAELYTDQITSTRVITKQIITISKTEEHCEDFNAFLKDEIVDKISPITVQVSTDVIQDLDNLPAGEIPHVLDVYTQVKDAQIPIFVDCLSDKCSPDLQTSVKSDKPVLYFGDDTEVALTVTVANTADEAFGAFLYVLLPDDTKYLSSSLIKSDLVIICEMNYQAKSVACDIGNPLPKKTEVVFEIRLQINPVPGDRTTLPIQLIANSTSEENEDTRGDNDAVFTWELQPEVGLLLDGSANIDQLIYNDTDVGLNGVDRNVTDTSSEKADRVVYTYWVQNLGPATISSASLEVMWPMKTDDGSYLLYLTSVSLSNGKPCHVEGGVDPDNLSGDENEMIGRPTKSIKRSRQASKQVMALEDDSSRVVSADCSVPGYSGCINITCNLGRMDKDGMNTILTIESALMLDSLLQDDEPKEWDITSSAVFKVHSIPYVTQPEKTPSTVKTLSLRAIPLTFLHKEPVPLWAIILSVVLGTLLLIIVVVCLYKAGFFKRNKIDLEELKRTYERQNDIDEMNTEEASKNMEDIDLS